MKRRSVAIILGLVMAISPVNAFAAESVENTETEITESTEFISDEAEAIVGKVLSVEEDNITIAEGMIPDAVITDQDDTEVPESTADGTEKEEASGKDADEAELAPELELTGEERTVTVTADTRISRMYLEPEAKDGEIVSGTEAPASEETTGDEPLALEETGDDVNVELFINDEAADSGELELPDIKEGDVVSVTIDEDGNATEIIVWQYGEYADGAETDNEAGIELVLDDTEEASTDSGSTDTDSLVEEE
ncbi:MAG: hypothetical protein Q4C59_11555 [Lachnospiraceae bacterium]|nr:hypothetical protein [Lachnospiraceae bacterium]